MRYYPAYLDIKERPCLVVGGGQVGTRKVKTLLACGAVVTVVSPEVSDDLAALASSGRIQWKRRTYEPGDLEDAFLVIGATDDQASNARIHEDAEAANRLCNIADQPERCNFVLPSVINRGDLSIAISTGGKSPAFARHLRRQLESQFGPEYEPFLALMGAIRHRMLAGEHAPEAHKPMFRQLIASGLLEMVRDGSEDRIDALLNDVLGPDYRYRDLMTEFEAQR